MNEPLTPNPSEWLLPEEPDLTPDQVWMVLAFYNGRMRKHIVLADTAEQAKYLVPGVLYKRINEAQLTMVLNRSAGSAILGTVFGFRAMRARVRRVRQDRGNGASWDGRFQGHFEDRMKALDISRLAGGPEEYEREQAKGVAWLNDLLQRKQQDRACSPAASGQIQPL